MQVWEMNGLRPMRILVTGSREWPFPRLITSRLDFAREVASQSAYRGIVVAHGGCWAGADTVADQWCDDHEIAKRVYRIPPAAWRDLGRSAGPERNRRMVADFQPDLTFAFIADASRGASGTLALVRRDPDAMWIRYDWLSADPDSIGYTDALYLPRIVFPAQPFRD